MRLTRSAPTAGLLPGFVRHTGLVHDAGDADGPIWVDVPEALADQVVDRLDPWLPWLLPHAVATQQPLVLDGPVDADLLRHMHELMEIWARWRPTHRPVPVHAETADPSPDTDERTGLFFTGGVDSFFTLVHHDAMGRAHPAWRQRPVDDLVYVWGFDIPLAHQAAFAGKRATLQRVANETGTQLVPIVTNLRETGVQQPWGQVMHGPALGGAGLLLGRRWRTMLLSSWFCHEDARPWGSTAITDPLFSTGTTRTRSYGASHDRFEKLAFLVDVPLVLDTLHVCWQERSDSNCGQCEKCLRTLLALDVLGVRARAATFPPGPLALDRLAEVWKADPLFVSMYVQLQAHASQAGRDDIVAAIAACLARSGSPS